MNWIVVSMVSDASFGPFTEGEAKRFAGRNKNYEAFEIATLRRDMYSRLRWGALMEFCQSCGALHEPGNHAPIAPRFVLLSTGDESYHTGWDTWEEAQVAWEDDGIMPAGFKLYDQETGREWLPGARYEWEDART